MRVLTCLSLLIVFLTFTGCATVGHREAGIDNFDEVSPALFRGAQPSAEGVHTLVQQYHVKTVINLRDGDDASEARWVKEAGMTYVHLPLDAEKVTEADAEQFLAILAQADGPVFVHCLVGRDRTGMAVAAYRVCVENWTEQAAVKDMIDHGHFWVWFPKVRQSIAELAQVHAMTARVIAADATVTPVTATPAVAAPVADAHPLKVD